MAPPPTMKDVIREILFLVGQNTISTECGGDFPECGVDSNKDCPHFWDCDRQRWRMKHTEEIRKMLEEVE